MDALHAARLGATTPTEELTDTQARQVLKPKVVNVFRAAQDAAKTRKIGPLGKGRKRRGVKKTKRRHHRR